MTELTQKWVDRFFDRAKEVSTWSKDPSTQVGCVAVKNRRTVSEGYNGFPEGVNDDESRYADAELKYKLIVHAELNAVFNAAQEGVSLKGADVFIHGLPCCHECAKGLIRAGVKKVWMKHGPMKEKWRESFEYSKLMFDEAGVEWQCFEVGSRLSEGPYWEP